MPYNYDSYDNLSEIIDGFKDDNFWKPFFNDTIQLDSFHKQLSLVKESENWDKTRNKEKGSVLEQLVLFIFRRFDTFIEDIQTNNLTNDNEKDVILTFKQTVPTFLKNINGKLICECKNVYSKSVDVGNVAKLNELCDRNKAGLGIFISVLGLSGSGWKWAEGKVRKLYLSNRIPLISFNLNEIEKLSHPGYNLYTMIRQKHQRLIDEVDFYSGKPIKSSEDFIKMLTQNIHELVKMELISTVDRDKILNNIFVRYGTTIKPRKKKT